MLEIKELVCGYDSKFLLKDINLKINATEIVGIIGPNGSGKTTLLRAITRVIKPKKGKIIFQGKDIQLMRFNEIAREIAIVSQYIHIVENVTVEEFVLLGRIPYYKRFQFLETKKDIEIAEKCMRLTDIYELKDHFLGKISGGERQRALIAKALCQEPSLLLLDEPTAHLDIAHQVGILDLISKLNKETGLTVIIILHDLNLASEYCNRLVLINNGMIHKIGLPEEVLNCNTIKEVYKTSVIIEKNPISNKPHILIVSDKK